MLGVFRKRLIFPYLTIIQRSQGEREEDFLERAALVATCILSSHVKPLRSLGKYNRFLGFLRDFVIIMDVSHLDSEFSVFEAKPGSSAGATYVFRRLSLVNDCQPTLDSFSSGFAEFVNGESIPGNLR